MAQGDVPEGIVDDGKAVLHIPSQPIDTTGSHVNLCSTNHCGVRSHALDYGVDLVSPLRAFSLLGVKHDTVFDLCEFSIG